MSPNPAADKEKDRGGEVKKRIECLDCSDTGLAEVDAGGGRTSQRYCKCPRGQELFEAAERARSFWDDWRINPDRKHD